MHIRQATISDFPNITTTCELANENDEILTRLYPYRHRFPGDYRRWRPREYKYRFYDGCTVLVMFTDKEDPEWNDKEQVIAVVAVKHSFKLNTSPSWIGRARDRCSWVWRWLNLKLSDIDEDYIRHFNLNRSADQAAIQKCLSDLDGPSRLDKIRMRPHWYLDLLATDPSFQKRGIGGQLVDEAQAMANRDNVPLVLHASEAARSLYLRKGFKSLGNDVPGDPGDAMVWMPVDMRLQEEY